MKKGIIIIQIMMLILVMSLASAATVVTLDPTSILSNATFQTSSTVTYGVLVTGNQTTYDCDLYTTENGSNGAGTYSLKVNNFPVSNNTNTTFVSRTAVADAVGSTAYVWNVYCNGVTDVTGAWGLASEDKNITFGVDITAPVIVLYNPSSNGAWYTDDSAVRIGLNVTDTNANTCTLQSNLDVTNDNTTTFNTAFENYDYTSETAFNFAFVNASQDWGDDATGLYKYTYNCSDDAGNTAELGSNYTFFVDTVAPTTFVLNTSLWKTDNVALWNATTATDYTPQIGWGLTTELNFSRYLVCYYNDSYSDTSTTCKNITTKTTLATNITTLDADEDYWINITAYDVAGNSRSMTTSNYKYSTDSTNRALKAGWNIIGNVGNNLTLSQILNWSGATTASIWNSTHEFQSHVSGGSYGTTSVGAGQTALIYVATDTTFSDLVWNTTAVAPNTAITVSNSTDAGSNSAWNLVMNRAAASKTVQAMDSYMNCNTIGAGCTAAANNATNIDYMSVYNNSANIGAKYISYVANWSINNATPLTYGDTSWLYVNSAASSISVNWSAI